MIIIFNFLLNLFLVFITSYLEIKIRSITVFKAFNAAKQKKSISNDYLHMVLSESVQFAKTLKNIIEFISSSLITLILLIYLTSTNDQLWNYKFHFLLCLILILLLFSFPKINPLLILSNLRYKYSKSLTNQMANSFKLLMDYKFLGMNYKFQKKVAPIFKKNGLIYGIQTVSSNFPARLTELIIYILIILNASNNSVSGGLSIETLSSYGYIIVRLRSLIVNTFNVGVRIANKKQTLIEYNKYINSDSDTDSENKIIKNYINKEHLKKNKIINLYGNSGSGKTTYLMYLYYQLKKRKEKISLTLQHPSINMDEFKDNFINYQENHNKIMELFGLLNLNNKFKKELPNKIKYLSGGEIKRIAIVRQLLLGSDFLLLDEPLSEVDDKNQLQILLLLKQMSKTKVIVITSHKKIPGLININFDK